MRVEQGSMNFLETPEQALLRESIAAIGARSASHGGRIAEVRVAEGEQVEGGRVLVVLEESS